jgi:hypothetical protein
VNPSATVSEGLRVTQQQPIVVIPIVILLLMLSACASIYTARGFWGELLDSDGFSETQLAQDVYTVNFSGNGLTSSERTRDFALLRCAELTELHGYRYFSVLDQSAERRISSRRSPAFSPTQTASLEDNWMKTPVPGSSNITNITNITSEPSTHLTIQFLIDKPDTATVVYEADFVSKSIRAKYALKPSH